MKPILLTFILLTHLYCDQNLTAALGAQKETQDPLKSFKQKDGSCFNGISHEKGYFNYIELENGYTVLYNKETKQYEYAHIRNGALLPSGIPVQARDIPAQIQKIPQQTLEQLETDAFKKHF